tara:strand:- start:365 stop:526 length:162 start_codon:yes stop_codon:yes gene_type:complete
LVVVVLVGQSVRLLVLAEVLVVFITELDIHFPLLLITLVLVLVEIKGQVVTLQ